METDAHKSASRPPGLWGRRRLVTAQGCGHAKMEVFLRNERRRIAALAERPTYRVSRL